MAQEIPSNFENRILEKVVAIGGASLVNGALVIKNPSAALLFNLIEQSSLRELVQEFANLETRIMHRVPNIAEILQKKRKQEGELTPNEETQLELAYEIGMNELGVLGYCMDQAAKEMDCEPSIEVLKNVARVKSERTVIQEVEIPTIRTIVQKILEKNGGAPQRELIELNLNGKNNQN